MFEKKYFFYVLHTNDNYFYSGATKNLVNRIEKHKSKKGAKFTKISSRHPLKLIYFETFNSWSEALKFEYNFKKKTRSQKGKYINENIFRKINFNIKS